MTLPLEVRNILQNAKSRGWDLKSFNEERDSQRCLTHAVTIPYRVDRAIAFFKRIETPKRLAKRYSRGASIRWI
jgi:hypothetical protein